jgi:hypothetical protein
MSSIAAASALICVSRDSGYADRLRSYSVVVDGRKIGKIANGETKSFPIDPGEHTLKLKIAWCGSNTIHFDADTSQTVDFQCASSLRGWKIFLATAIAIFTPNQYLRLSRLAA